MGAIASQITSLTIVCSTVYSGADQREHQSSPSLAFVRRIHRWPVNSPHKWPVKRKMFPFDDVIVRCHNLKWYHFEWKHPKYPCICILLLEFVQTATNRQRKCLRSPDCICMKNLLSDFIWLNVQAKSPYKPYYANLNEICLYESDPKCPHVHAATLVTNIGNIAYGVGSIGTLETSFCEIWMEIYTFSLNKMKLKNTTSKWQPLCRRLNLLLHRIIL